MLLFLTIGAVNKDIKTKKRLRRQPWSKYFEAF